MDEEIKAVIDKFRAGNEEDAFFELLEMPGDVVPVLIDCFRSEALAPVRAFLVKAAWERRDELVISFLGEALNDVEEEVWQAALDGLVSFATDESLRTLHSARMRRFPRETDHRRFHLWLEEAIQQVHFELRGHKT